MSETKEQVFEALLAIWSNAVLWKTDKSRELNMWRERYEKAERFGRGHDVDDLYVYQDDGTTG